MVYHHEADGWLDVGVLLQEFQSRYKIPIDQHAGPHWIDAFEQSFSGVIVLGRGSEVLIHSFACRRANTIGPHQHVRKSTRTVGEMKDYFPCLGINDVGCELFGCVRILQEAETCRRRNSTMSFLWTENLPPAGSTHTKKVKKCYGLY